PHDWVDRRDDGNGVRDEATAQQGRQRLQVHEARSPHVEAVWLVRAVRDHVATELAPGRLDRGVYLARRHLEAPREDLEMVDERFHRLIDARSRRWRHLLVLRP